MTDRIIMSEGVAATNALIRKTLLNARADFWEMTRHLAQADGKYIRTSLLLRCAADADGFVDKDAITFAAAIEILHLASLVHDDVIDDAPTRRNQESVQRKFGKKKAVILGDYLMCLSMSMVSGLYDSYKERGHLYKSFIKAMSDICCGEYAQFESNGNLDLGLFGYLRAISGKTAAMFYLSAFCGAIAADNDDAEARRIARIGRYIGMAFQIADDLKDYEASESVALKPVRSDITEGVITLPLILAIKKQPRIRALAARVLSTGLGKEILFNEIAISGGLDDSREAACRYLNKTSRFISGLKHPHTRQHLEGFLIELKDIFQFR